MTVKKKIGIAIQSWLMLYAITFSYTVPLSVADYKSKLHFLFAQATEVLGGYHIEHLLLFGFLYMAVVWISRSEYVWFYPGKALPCFFSLCLVVGGSLDRTDGLDGIFATKYSFLKAFLAFFGFALLLYYLIAVLNGLYQKAASQEWKPGKFGLFLGEKGFFPIWLLLLAVWAPIILISYPGNLCYDGLGSISQGLGYIPYTSHHPLLFTLFVSTLVKLSLVSALVGLLRNNGIYVVVLTGIAMALVWARKIGVKKAAVAL